MAKFLYYCIPMVMIIGFVLIMASSPLLKQPMGKNDNVEKYIKIVNRNIIDEKWTDAAKNQKQLKSAWEKVVRRIQFGAERDEMNDINKNIARLKGYIKANDKADALAELSELKNHWYNIRF
ncbi:hypothetical protein JOD45_002274 [Scopulibacillus daqui]|uniref:DUF4363 family protein n=1 Tax=Scopulibacillus daqui TaxID=1469162 RepID=A0ABS2Q178_9BACL|nr:DUF4363 family protein [Scopulibacillus daqui]MBM7646049.1 hypothetical protein [Scopulibacillus daqui]